MEFKLTGGNKGSALSLINQREEGGVIYADISFAMPEPCVPEPFKLSFDIPLVDSYSVWSPSAGFDRALRPDWSKKTTVSRLASWMPLHSVLSVGGKNRITVAISDVKTPSSIASGVREEDARLMFEVTFFTIPVAPLSEYFATVRIDMRDTEYCNSIYGAVEWWEKECGYTPAPVPEHALLPMNSLWYTYHQKLDAEDIIKECRLSRELGMDTVIIDDGWQTDDNARGYAYCGDWKLATTKISDMKEFVRRIHATGMKVMLWYSVPFIGRYSESFEKFKDKLLFGTGNGKDHWAIDPRYPECREYLKLHYVNAIREWDLDGLKLDFIDAFALKGSSLEYDERRDFRSLEDAIDALLSDVADAIRNIKKNIMIEFRQSYIGPAIRKYGNMLRVGDCPDDAVLNRRGTVDLRLTSGSTAVHSDMLMWNMAEPVENAALQFVSALYAVPQISVKIAKLPADHYKMLAFYLAFWRENRDVLVGGKLYAQDPAACYSVVWAKNNGKAIYTVYINKAVDLSEDRKAVVVNATQEPLVIKGIKGKSYRVSDCMGNTVSLGVGKIDIEEIAVPLCGMVTVE